MKCASKIFLILSLCFLVQGFNAFGREMIRKSIKLDISTALPPQAKTSGTSGANFTNFRSHWVQADIKFRTNEIRNAAMRFLDNPQLDIQIVSYPGRKPDRGEKAVIFSGKIDYVTLEFDGRDHYLKALLPAVLFRRYAYDAVPGRTVFIARATYSAGGKVIAVVYGSNKGVSDKEIRDFFRAVPRNAVQAADTVYGRQGTTWSIIDVNKYEMEKIR